jgi:hypothetical protein
MAFTSAQKRDIRKYLGVPFGFYDLNTRLESVMDLVGSNATDQAEVDEWLLRLTEIDDALVGVSGTGSGSGGTTTATFGALKRVDEIEFHPPSDSDSGGGGGEATSLTLIQQGRALIDRLARAFGVSDYLPVGDYFGTRRPIGFSMPLG